MVLRSITTGHTPLDCARAGPERRAMRRVSVKIGVRTSGRCHPVKRHCRLWRASSWTHASRSKVLWLKRGAHAMDDKALTLSAARSYIWQALRKQAHDVLLRGRL